MTTKEKLMADMKQAMKDREAGKLRLEVIRMIRSDIRNAEINSKGKEELTEVIQKAIAETGAQGPKGMGLVMKAVLPQVQGRADGSRISRLAKTLLSQ